MDTTTHVIFDNLDQLKAVNAALAGFEPHPCSDHAEGEHGDETGCFGYGPKTLKALGEGADILAHVEWQHAMLAAPTETVDT